MYITNSATAAVDSNIPLVVETDTSDCAIAASLRQSGHQVAFFSRTNSQLEQQHSVIEKEAYIIVEALKKWQHYLISHHLRLITDQKSVAFMYKPKMTSQIKK